LFDKAEGITVKCNYCDGDPQCVRFCETKAIRYIDASQVNAEKQYTAAERLLGTFPKQGIPL
jgi:Fe-S-cluster-containing hydrogenase component 2